MAEEQDAASRPTITPKEDFDPGWAVQRFNNAMKGIGTDEKQIIKHLVTHDNLQRKEIAKKYKESYGKDLVGSLKDELSGLVEKCAVALLTTPYELLSTAIYDALTIWGDNPEVLVEIICSRDPSEIQFLDEFYTEVHHESLADAFSHRLSGDFSNLMVGLSAAGRDCEDQVDEALAEEEAQLLYDSGLGLNTGTDEAEFIRVLIAKCYKQLKLIFEKYKDIAGEDIETSITSECSGDFRKGLLAIVKRVKDPPAFFAERLKQSMKSISTDDDALIRILVSRSEVDLEDVQEKYNQMYPESSLAKDIKDDTSGDYRKLLLAILNPKDVNNIIHGRF